MILKIVFMIFILTMAEDTPKDNLIMLDSTSYIGGKEVMYDNIPDIDNITDTELRWELREKEFLETALQE